MNSIKNSVLRSDKQTENSITKIKELWLEISNYGIEDDISYLERIRVRVLNQAIIIVATIQSSIFISHLYPFQIGGVLSGLVILIVLFYLLHLNKNKKYRTARLILNFFMPLAIFLIGFLYGGEVGIQYNFLTFILTAFFFHERFRTKLTLALFNLSLYLILKYCWAHYEPIFTTEAFAFIEIITFVITAIAIVTIIHIFLSEIEKYNEKNKKLLKTLEEKNARLQIANEELERFAYIASHDLKTPLRTIISFTGLLERDFERNKLDSFPDYFSFVKKGAKQMDSLISSTLEYSKVNHVEVLEKQLVDLNRVVEEIKRQLIQNHGENISIVYNELPTILAEKGQMTLLFQNLIENGLKYNKSENKVVKIMSIFGNDKTLIQIEDNGIGINEKYHKQIFSMFKRLHTSTQYEGTGLGLAICKKIVDRMNGRIWLESEEGKGTIFNIELLKEL